MSSFDDDFGSFSRRLRLIVVMLLEGANNRENGQKNSKGTFSLFRYKSNGWEFLNREGSHATYSKKINGTIHFLQVIYNSKTIHPSNAKNMIEKSDIPLQLWVKGCK